MADAEEFGPSPATGWTSLTETIQKLAESGLLEDEDTDLTGREYLESSEPPVPAQRPRDYLGRPVSIHPGAQQAIGTTLEEGEAALDIAKDTGRELAQPALEAGKVAKSRAKRAFRDAVGEAFAESPEPQEGLDPDMDTERRLRQPSATERLEAAEKRLEAIKAREKEIQDQYHVWWQNKFGEHGWIPGTPEAIKEEHQRLGVESHALEGALPDYFRDDESIDELRKESLREQRPEIHGPPKNRTGPFDPDTDTETPGDSTGWDLIAEATNRVAEAEREVQRIRDLKEPIPDRDADPEFYDQWLQQLLAGETPWEKNRDAAADASVEARADLRKAERAKRKEREYPLQDWKYEGIPSSLIDAPTLPDNWEELMDRRQTTIDQLDKDNKDAELGLRTIIRRERAKHGTKNWRPDSPDGPFRWHEVPTFKDAEGNYKPFLSSDELEEYQELWRRAKTSERESSRLYHLPLEAWNTP